MFGRIDSFSWYSRGNDRVFAMNSIKKRFFLLPEYKMADSIRQHFYRWVFHSLKAENILVAGFPTAICFGICAGNDRSEGHHRILAYKMLVWLESEKKNYLLLP